MLANMYYAIGFEDGAQGKEQLYSEFSAGTRARQYWQGYRAGALASYDRDTIAQARRDRKTAEAIRQD